MKTVVHISDLTQRQKTSLSLARYFWMQLNKFKQHVIDFAKFSYVIAVLALLIVAVIELKHIYQVDLFPGVDTPFDNLYYAGKDQFNKGVLKLITKIFKA